MQRNENESFDAYKARRAASNLAVKLINKGTKGGTVSARAKLRDALRDAGKLRGLYGANILAQFAQRNATAGRLIAHKSYGERIENRRQQRLLQAS